VAQRICEASGLPWQVCVVHAYTESGWGFRRLASEEHNNRWGIKAGRVYSPTTINKLTTEFVKAGKVKVSADFASWPTMEQGVEGWIAFLSRPRYKRPLTWDFADDAARFITWIWGNGYATAPRYVERYAAVSRKLGERIGDESLIADIDPPLAACIAEIRAKPPGQSRRDITKALGVYGFSNTCRMT
jgi:flagellum-specific peptidoglycan hydrolase FlgJ